MWAQVDAPGAASDAQLWNESALRDAVISNTIGIPEPEPLPADDCQMPYLIIGDNAFALNEWLMKPFAATPLEQNDRVFSYRLSRARRCVENAFGALANRWGVHAHSPPTGAEERGDHGAGVCNTPQYAEDGLRR